MVIRLDPAKRELTPIGGGHGCCLSRGLTAAAIAARLNEEEE
jgi:hypothetical protein